MRVGTHYLFTVSSDARTSSTTVDAHDAHMGGDDLSTRGIFDRRALRTLIKRPQIEGFIARFFVPPVVRSYRHLSGGTVKLLYRVQTDRADVVLHILQPLLIGLYERTPADFAYEFTFADALAASGVPVPRRYRARDGGAYVPVELGGVPCYLTVQEFVPGNRLHWLDDDQLREATRMLAHMHTIGQRLRLAPPRMQGYTVGDCIAYREGSSPLLPPDLTGMPRVRPYLEEFRRTFNDAWFLIATHKDVPPRFPIHSDFAPRNLIFQGARLAALVDFDECRDDCAYVDLTIALQDFCAADAPRRVKDFIRRFFGYYTDVHALSPLDIDLTLSFWVYRQAHRAYRQLTAEATQQADIGKAIATAERRLKRLQTIEHMRGGGQLL